MVYFSGLSNVRVLVDETYDVIAPSVQVEEGRSTRVHCDFSTEYVRGDKEEEVYSVLWYWIPPTGVDKPVPDLRLWPLHAAGGPNSGRPSLPSVPVQFYRFVRMGAGKEDKQAWLTRLRGIFTVNVSIQLPQ